MSASPRVLFYDIETSLQAVTVFDLRNNDYISPESIVTERHMICAAWKWQGDKRIHTVSLLDDPKRYAKDHRDDTHVVAALHGVLGSADVIIGHNSDAFDLKYLETRALKHGLPALPPITSIDTYKAAKARFKFSSNKLNFIGGYLGVGQKKQTSPGLWMRVFNGDKRAIKEMVAYNKQDVLLLERVFNKLAPYIPNHISRELFGLTGCPRCGSKKVQSRGFHRALTHVYRRFQCQNPKCMGWFRALRATPATATHHRVI